MANQPSNVTRQDLLFRVARRTVVRTPSGSFPIVGMYKPNLSTSEPVKICRTNDRFGKLFTGYVPMIVGDADEFRGVDVHKHIKLSELAAEIQDNGAAGSTYFTTEAISPWAPYYLMEAQQNAKHGFLMVDGRENICFTVRHRDPTSHCLVFSWDLAAGGWDISAYIVGEDQKEFRAGSLLITNDSGRFEKMIL